MSNTQYKVIGLINTKIQSKKFRVKGKEHYLMALKISSDSDPGLKKVQKVEYLLHPTFKDRLRTSHDRSNHFLIEFWAWGTFLVDVTIFLVDDKTTTIKFDMTNEIKKGVW